MTITESRSTIREADAPPAQPPRPKAPPMRPPAQNRSWLILVGAWLGGIALLVATLALAIAAIDAGGESETAATGSDAAAAAPMTVDVELGDLFVKPSAITVRPGQELTLNVTNNGAMPHDLKVDGTTGSAMLDPGQSETIELGSFSESVEAWCTVPGHKEAGMVLDIKVEGAAAPAKAADAAASEAAVIDFTAAPGPDWKRFDPALEPAPGATVHNVTWDMTEEVVEIAPGVKQEVWTFGGQMPGPTLRGKVGDVFNVTIVNQGAIGHSIDFHASKTPMNVDMRTIKPGESLTYQFKADFAGIWMYHCGTAPALHHIGNGMFGAVIIDPPGLPQVDREVVLVQQEWYTGPQGKPGDLTKMVAEQHDAVMFNGYVNQYLHDPIKVQPGERIRAWVLDVGPSENSSFHIVGTIFDTVYKEGTYLLRPSDLRGGAQSLDLQAAQGGFVEFTLDEPGNYAMVTHKFANVGKGALGLFQVEGEVVGAPAGGSAGH